MPRGKRQREKERQKEQQKQEEIRRRQEERIFKKKVADLIESLQESDGRALLQIDRIIERIGLDFALEKLQEAEAVETQGGLMLNDGSRRRTKGGVFFFLVKKWLKEEERRVDMKEIFYKNQRVIRPSSDDATTTDDIEATNAEVTETDADTVADTMQAHTTVAA
jgi:phosphorylated adapter RNA export protein